MEEENIHVDLFTRLKDQEATLEEPEQPVAITQTPTEWPVLPGSQESSLPGQRTPNNHNTPATPISWTIKEKTTEENERYRVGKYAPYSQSNTILPIPDLVAVMEPKTLSLIVTDLRTRGLTGLKKGILRRATENCRHPMPVFLPAKLRHLETPAALEGPSIKTSREQHNNEVFPAPTRQQGKTDDKGDRV